MSLIPLNVSHLAYRSWHQTFRRKKMSILGRFESIMLCSSYWYQGKWNVNEAKTYYTHKITSILTCCFNMLIFCLVYSSDILFFLVRGDAGITECGHSDEHKGGTICFFSLAWWFLVLLLPFLIMVVIQHLPPPPTYLFPLPTLILLPRDEQLCHLY